MLPSPLGSGSTLMHPIQLRGARTNNLKAVSLDLEPGTLLVVTGPSGAGKSSLALGTLYAEGQRRYVESFSAYARQFLERMQRPPLQSLRWMPAAIAVDRGGQVKTSRSTVATLTELSDCLKQLWAVSATPHCARCRGPVRVQSAETAGRRVREQLGEERLVVCYPRPVASEEDFLVLRDELLTSGYRRLWVASELRDLDTLRPSEALRDARAQRNGGPPSLSVVVDRTTGRAQDESRLRQALEAAFERGAGGARLFTPGGSRLELSEGLSCERCGEGFRKPSPGLFSWNSPIGACEQCRGFGRTIGVDYDKVFADRGKTLSGGAIRPWAGKAAKHERKLLFRHCERSKIPIDVPLRELSAEQITTLVEGDGGNWRTGYPGLRRWFTWLESRAYKMHVRVLLARYRSYDTCTACSGKRFRPEVLGYTLDGMTLPDFYALEVAAAAAIIEKRLQATAREDTVTQRVLEECRERLHTLQDVGLGYLTLDRSARTLSGGELQRVGLASALDSRLRGTLFVLDEPTLGLHPSDVARLLPVVRRLTGGDNIVLVVDSDERLLEGADRVLELGPGAGEAGGAVVFDGPPAALRMSDTPTARWLRAQGAPGARTRQARGGELLLRGATGNNLREVTLRVPLGVFTCVTGVSGSGKSSLIVETLVPAVQRALGASAPAPLAFQELSGGQGLGRCVLVDQAPLGRTSRGNPATYLGIWEAFRRRFTATKLAKERGYKAGFFSFNVAGGRCEACKGDGSETVEMQFLADVRLSCPECGGRRFVGPVLDVTIEGKNAAEVLELTAADAAARFAGYPDLAKALRPLTQVGAAYLKLGQPLSTLSGGEAQRLKLAQALAEVAAAREPTLVVLDEPTAGLHGADLERLLVCLEELVSGGDSVLVVEHDMRLAARADHVIDLGPGAGLAGGLIVAEGTPEEVARSQTSATAPHLQAALARASASSTRAQPAMASAAPVALVCVRGAREHNLKNVDVDIPRDKLVVVTGPSGSGKSTLAFDVVFAEAQRRYFETLSPYVRQYLKQLPRPEVDRVEGMPPGVSLEQRQSTGARNSTVATVTEVAHYLRLLYARVGLLHCPECKVPIAPRPLPMLAADVAARFGKREVQVLAAVVRSQKGAHRDVLTRAQAAGVRSARIDGRIVELTPGMKLDRYKEHDIELVLGSERASAAGLQALLGRALEQADGSARVLCGGAELLLSSRRACPSCGRGFPELDPRFFSFNTKQGACEACEGAGLVERTRGRSKTAESLPCPACQGRRLSGLALHTTVDGVTITDLLALSVDAALVRARALRLEGRDAQVGEAAAREVVARLGFLQRVGLGYLGLDRAAHTLSGGELQRVRLAGQLGSGLTGVLYVLDEPTIGLHARDTARLLEAIKALVAEGCSVLVVEHDADTIRAADHVIDVGPAGGHEGGRIVAEGSPSALFANPASVTGRSLGAPARLRKRQRPVDEAAFLELSGAREHNLKDITLRVPAGRFVAVTGVSGSGKSTLVREVFLRALRKELGLASERAGAYEALAGVVASGVQRAVEIDQSPIGRTPRSVPATYVGVWDELRKLYARTPDARARGYDASRFSFNVDKGRCNECEGQGALSVEMTFLPDALVPCESCRGLRYDSETLAVRMYGASIGELLRMHVDDAARRFAAVPSVRRPLELMCELGLGYLELGQPSNTLSGGEAQRLKLVSELSASGAGPTLYVLDEPTTGLHRQDVERLLDVLDRLVDRGDTLLVIEHHPDLILRADWVIDLGPEGGEGGGRVVAEGTPERVMQARKNHTGAALRRALGRREEGPHAQLQAKLQA